MIHNVRGMDDDDDDERIRREKKNQLNQCYHYYTVHWKAMEEDSDYIDFSTGHTFISTEWELRGIPRYLQVFISFKAVK